MSTQTTPHKWPYPSGKKHRAAQGAQAAWDDYNNTKGEPQGRRVKR